MYGLSVCVLQGLLCNDLEECCFYQSVCIVDVVVAGKNIIDERQSSAVPH